MSSLIAIPATFGNGFMGIIIGLPASIIITMAIIFVFKNKVIEEDQGVDTSKAEEMIKPKISVNMDDKLLKLNAPTKGEICALQDLSDETFAKEMMGKGIAILPQDNQICAPADGIITALFPTKHAIGMKTKDGLEVLIHIGIDTVNLNGKYFEAKVNIGDTVVQGQTLIVFDYQKVAEEHYDTHVIMVITNSDDYLDIFSNQKIETVTKDMDILTVIQ